ncbi:hypothetical protein [Rhizobium leucaenae]|uniref:Uncharacterized protein n=1 Tax=Rhizobium leucaenae TaxID=29450 RepID=A0A7W7EKC3_9HYPH|nr:hypothetical protein [Rhizobium leucaenae]MBB4568262.1 hypothetical protein [Rhizobium leucaenae]MBB6304349.1 hypothetical protein [Rhizobium leucaenae]
MPSSTQFRIVQNKSLILKRTYNEQQLGKLEPIVNKTTANPRLNSSINPTRNSYLRGPFLYTAQERKSGFLVRANEIVYLILNMDAVLKVFAVKNAIDGYATFDLQERWVRHPQNGYLCFHVNDDWTGFIIL